MRTVLTTRRRLRRIFAGVLLAALMIMLTGCFGPMPPKPQFISISGTVSAPPSGDPSGQAMLAALDDTPVVGARVAAFDFATSKQVGTTATAGTSGRYTISDIPKGIDVVVVAIAGAGTRNGFAMRLSTLVADAANGADGSIDGATSLAAEAWGAHYGQGVDMHAWDFQTSLDAARAVLARLGWLDLTPGGTMLSTEYGGGLADRSELAPVTGTVPDTINPLVGPAKEMVQDLRDAGLTIQGTFEQELAEPAETVVTEVAPYLVAVGEHVGGLHPYIIMDPIEFPWGKYEEYEDGSLNTEPIGLFQEPKWEIVRNDGVSMETWTVSGGIFGPLGAPRRWTVRELMTSTIAFDVTSSENQQFEFNGSLVLTSDEDTPELITGAVLSATLKDPLEPCLAEATLITGDYEGHFDLTEGTAHVGVNGNFNSPYVVANGRLIIDGSLQTGGTVVFEGDISAAGVTVAGGLALSAVANSTVPGIGLAPSDVTINGRLQKVGLSAPIFAGETRISVSNAGGLRLGEHDVIGPGNWPQATVEFEGTVNPSGKASVRAEITVSTAEPNVFTATVRYDHGTRWLNGTVDYTISEGEGEDEGKVVHEGLLNVTNQAGLNVRVEMRYVDEDDYEIQGTIKNASNDTIGSIVRDLDGIVRIEYIDGTWESLF